MSHQTDWPSYTYLDKAAAEARAASRRYWAKGGEADRKYPCQPMPYWPEAPTEEEVPAPAAKTRRGKAG